MRKIKPSNGDVLHKLKMGERIDNLAQKYYKDPTLAWVIACANPEYDNEFEIPIGATVRIPYPLQRVWDGWLISNEI
jgi:nucleoid-associated protein YgaU